MQIPAGRDITKSRTRAQEKERVILKSLELGDRRMEVDGNHMLVDVPSKGERLKGKVAIITGGARGIGAATARIFAENGAKVIVADILDDLGTKLCQEIIPSAIYIHCDVSKEDDVAAAVDEALNAYGRLDIMFNNAGIMGPSGSILELNMDKVNAVIGVNLKGVLHGIKHAARAMVASKIKGSILCTSSSAALMGGLAPHVYTLTKDAIVGLVKSSACELGEYGIRVNCISPHGVPSEMLVASYRKIFGDHMTAKEVSEIVALGGSLLQGRSATVDDSALAALFLASEEGGFISGHNLVVDGGFTSACRNMRLIYHRQFDHC